MALVVPVLEVLVDGSLLCIGILVSHGSEATLSLSGLAMEDAVEFRIARMVLLFKGRGSHVDSNWKLKWDKKGWIGQEAQVSGARDSEAAT